jgi:DNA modification methylase
MGPGWLVVPLVLVLAHLYHSHLLAFHEAAHGSLCPDPRYVWQVKKINPQSMVHLTEKPVELAVRAIQYGSRPGENVLDLFGGSGSTLIAAEMTGRRAFLMEIDPAYCDVIITRWEQFTGKKAKRLRDPRARRRHRDRGKEDSRGAAGGEVA